MNHQGTKKSRAWTIVVASTAVAAVGGASAAASWADTTVSSEAVSLSEQRVMTGTDPALDVSASTAAAQRFNDLAARVGTWTGPSIPAVSGAFATARDLAAAQDVHSASVQSVQSVASVVSAQSPASMQSTQSPASVQSAQSPASVQSAQSPASVQSAQSPASVQSPASMQSPASPDSVDSPASPDSADSPDY